MAMAAILWLAVYFFQLSMVIAAVHFMAQAAPFSFIDLYAEMLSGVFWKFTKTVAAVAPLLFGFFVGFKVLQSGNVSSLTS